MEKLRGFGDLVIAASLTTAAIMCVAIAYTPYVELMFIEFSIQGIMETFIAIGMVFAIIHPCADTTQPNGSNSIKQ